MGKQQKEVLRILREKGRIHKRSLAWIYHGRHFLSRAPTSSRRASVSRTLRGLKDAGLVQEQDGWLFLTERGTLAING